MYFLRQSAGMIFADLNSNDELGPENFNLLILLHIKSRPQTVGSALETPTCARIETCCGKENENSRWGKKQKSRKQGSGWGEWG